MNSLSEAIDYISAEPEQSREILKDKLNLGRDFIDWVWPDYLFIYSQPEQITDFDNEVSSKLAY